MRIKLGRFWVRSCHRSGAVLGFAFPVRCPLVLLEKAPHMEIRALKPILASSLLQLSVVLLICETGPLEGSIDDAFISYRYARNFAEGKGLVYNEGEYVEGFTDLLRTLLLTGGIACATDAETAGHVLGIFGRVLALTATFAYARALLPKEKKWLAGLSPVMPMTVPGFPSWCALPACIWHIYAHGRAGAFARTPATYWRADPISSIWQESLTLQRAWTLWPIPRCWRSTTRTPGAASTSARMSPWRPGPGARRLPRGADCKQRTSQEPRGCHGRPR